MPSTIDNIKAWGANTSPGQWYLKKRIDEAVRTGEIPTAPAGQDPRITDAVRRAFSEWQKDPEHQKQLSGLLPKLIKKKFQELFGGNT